MDTLIQGDARSVLAGLPESFAHAIITDPPYNLSFMGKEWDRPVPGDDDIDRRTGQRFSEYYHGGNFQRWTYLWAHQALRVLRPGSHMLVMAGTRTWHRAACGIEDAGFEIRDTLMWLYGSGFPKSLDVSKAIDKAAGEKRVIAGRHQVVDMRNVPIAAGDGRCMTCGRQRGGQPGNCQCDKHGQPMTKDAVCWEGFGTALKPAWEPIILARKPLEGTVAENVLRHGTGGLNIDATRIEVTIPRPALEHTGRTGRLYGAGLEGSRAIGKTTQGRWPANLILDKEVGAMLGGLSRFFYCPKPSRRERELGCDVLDPATREDVTGRKPGSAGQEHARSGMRRRGEIRNPHPTVKPVNLMRWFVRLACPPGGIVIDPFVGSGTTLIACKLEGMTGIGVDLDGDYLKIAAARLAHWQEYGG